MLILLRTILLLVVTLAAGRALFADNQPSNTSGFIIKRGVNISHWLSQDFGWAPREQWFTENDVRFIAASGFDHIRIPVDEIVLWNENGLPDDGAFALLQNAITWAMAANLRVVVDLHSVRAHHFNAANEGGHNTLWTEPTAQTHFLDLWTQLSTRLHHFPVNSVAYEIMNEPTAPDPEDWNRLVSRSLGLIRRLEPNRVIVIGGNLWQVPKTLPLLKIPESDKNIILSFHTYEPVMLTHHTASWEEKVIREYSGAVSYPGPIIDATTESVLREKYRSETFSFDYIGLAAESWGPDRFLKECAPAIAKARELGLQLYCGEFGCLSTVSRKARNAYFRDIVTTFESEGIAWAIWEYKGDFGIFEWHGVKGLNGAPDNELLDALLKK